jgi:hypothetical protein
MEKRNKGGKFGLAGFKLKKWDITFIRSYTKFLWLNVGDKISFPHGGVLF